MKKILLAVLIVLFFCGAAFAKVNINTASAEELATLNGIGKVKAEAIITWRTENGGFKTVDDLLKVKGIGAKTMEKLRDNVTVADDEKQPAAPELNAPAGKATVD